MKYMATYDEGTCDDRVCAKVLGLPFGDELNKKDCRLAARHARAMAAVLRASKRLFRAEDRIVRHPDAVPPEKLQLARDMASLRHLAAVARLEKVEKEVGRG